MLRIVLFMLSTSLIPVLGAEECLCTNSDVVIRTMPSPTAPVAGKLATGSCLKPSDFTRSDRWLQITGDQGPSGYLFESDALQRKPCTGTLSRRAGSFCPSHCQSDCCDDRNSHHHGVYCYSCGAHCCNQNQDDGPEWSNWSHCSGSCGQGTRSRTCTNRCHSLHSHTQTETCQHMISCPVWTTFSECSVTCGDGTMSRHCTYHCYGLHSQSETKTCHKPACEPEWSLYSDCSVTCGDGVQERHCTNHCTHHTTETQSCHNGHCHNPLNGHWSAWTDFGSCTATCGSGQQIRTRTCSNPAPAYGGQDCAPDANGNTNTHVKPCGSQECPNDLQGSSHKCNKLTTIEALAELSTTNPSNCPDVWASGSDHFLHNHCQAIPGTTDWKKGMSVGYDLKGNRTIQPYTPIATFWNNAYQQDSSHEGFSGIFISYTSNGFKMATRTCDGVAEVMDIPRNTTTFTNAMYPNDPFNYFTVRW
ncbi:semaphorin-5A-like [Mizuhopecten yessoensis]|uniref:Brain-specific angiogenesis inhibitor 1 n=1 Tax=Mizuhopecten yessoensis TaxID=6573 RepID=A0A210Q5X9_MIZYE|nr:semaphorin-5A-like [Mizuhopecten yessoensis]OWF44143.1 Brain-specific angiogenesis inhibitor 1 [Mizuhopecten yessoensis]